MARELNYNSVYKIFNRDGGWLSGMKANNTSERYKICRSAYHPFSIDATSLATDLMYMLNMPISEAEKDLFTEFFNSHQDANTGFYHEPFIHELDNSSIDRVVEMSGTYLSFQVCGALEAINRLPAHPFEFYEFTLKRGAISKYLEDRFPWGCAPWGAGGWVDSVATMLRTNIKMGYEEYSLPFNELLDWLKQNQNSKTGLWGNPDSYQKLTGVVNGGYHLLRGTFFQIGTELPYSEQVINTCINVYYENDYFKSGNGEGCHDLDLFDLLIQASTYNRNYRRDEISEICYKRLSDILSFQNDDGGFSFFPHKAQTEHNYYKVSPGEKESDMQGTVFYLHTIKRISEYLGFACNIKRSKTHGYE